MIALRIDAIQNLIGLPYARGARGPREFDCWGLCVEVYRRAGLMLPDYPAEHLSRAQARALAQARAPDHAEWIAKPEPWCFVFDQRNGHMGLHWGGRVLHASRAHGVVLERLNHFALAYPGMTFARWRD